MASKNGGLNKEETTNIRVSREIKSKFDDLGRYGENASDILTRIVTFYIQAHTPIDSTMG